MTVTKVPALPLVYVTVGGDHHPFDRLMHWMANWLEAGAADRVRCLVQHGPATPPRLATASPYLDHADVLTAMRSAHVVVSAGGPASFAEARSFGHLPLVVPRKAALGEVVDDHQYAFARRLATLGRLRLIETEPELTAALDEALAAPPPESTGIGDSTSAAALLTGRLIDEAARPSRRRLARLRTR